MLNPPSMISVTPLSLTAHPPVPQIASVSAAQPIPALGCEQLHALTQSPSAGIGGKLGYGPLSLFFKPLCPQGTWAQGGDSVLLVPVHCKHCARL